MSHRSVVTFLTGQCGIQIGKCLWEQLTLEHDIDLDGKVADTDDPCEIEALSTFFYETSSGRWMPKALFLDSEPGVVDALKKSSISGLFNRDFIMHAKQDCRNCMGYAWYPTFLGDAFHRSYVNTLRRLYETCDSISGNMYYQSTCGGTGTGLGCKLLQHTNEMLNKVSNIGIELTPSASISNCPMEAYNTVAYLGLTRYDTENMNVHMMLDNEALYRISKIIDPNKDPTFEDLNRYIARSMSNVTASLRFDGQLNVDLNEFQTNLVPFRGMNNLIISNAPIQSMEEREFVRVRDITLRAFSAESYMNSVDPFSFALKWPEEEEAEVFPQPIWFAEAEQGKSEQLIAGNDMIDEGVYYINHKFIACSMMYRGDVMPAKANNAIQDLKSKLNPKFVNWVPTGFKVGITNSPVIGSPPDWPYQSMNRTLTVISNNTVICERLKHFIRNFRLFNDMNAFPVWYSHGGFELRVMEASREGLIDLISQYEFSMGTMLEIEDLKQKLLQTPQGLGAY